MKDKLNPIFNDLSAQLDIKLEPNPFKIKNKSFVEVTKNAYIKSIEFEDIKLFNKKAKDFEEIPKKRFNEIGYDNKTIKFRFSVRGYGLYIKEYKMKYKNYFTVKEILDNILDFELYCRQLYKWKDGIDIGHIWFEGLNHVEDNIFDIIWGS